MWLIDSQVRDILIQKQSPVEFQMNRLLLFVLRKTPLLNTLQFNFVTRVSIIAFVFLQDGWVWIGVWYISIRPAMSSSVPVWINQSGFIRSFFLSQPTPPVRIETLYMWKLSMSYWVQTAKPQNTVPVTFHRWWKSMKAEATIKLIKLTFWT